jgi:hypothetical protein
MIISSIISTIGCSDTSNMTLFNYSGLCFYHPPSYRMDVFKLHHQARISDSGIQMEYFNQPLSKPWISPGPSAIHSNLSFGLERLGYI